MTVVTTGELIEDYPMECLYCQGKMERGTAPFNIHRHGYHLHWDAIPAWVCTQCGEPYFETREVDLIQNTLSILDRETLALEQEAIPQ